MQISAKLSLSILSAIVLGAAPLGCAAPATDTAQAGQSALGGDPQDGNLAEDPDLGPIIAEGFSGWKFAVTCQSMKDGAPPLDGEPLPVGNGRHLVCETGNGVARSTMSAMSSTGNVYCLLGDLNSYSLDGDERLSIKATATPASGPWTLDATHDGDEIQISRVDVMEGKAWPLWVAGNYKVAQVKPAVDGKTCDDVFGM